MKKSLKDYESFLNSISPPLDSDNWIIGGKNRNKMKYSSALKKYDPIAFNVGYREFLANNLTT